LSSVLGIHPQDVAPFVAQMQRSWTESACGQPQVAPPPLLADTPREVQPPLLTKTSSVHVLVVEDNAINQRITHLLLTKLGFKVQIANNGSEALDMLRKSSPPFDVVLMDIQMPVMSGWEAAARIRGMRLSLLPIVIAATAASTITDRDKSLEQMDDYISKPMSLQSLRDTLERAWNRSGRPALSFGDDISPAITVGSRNGIDLRRKEDLIDHRVPETKDQATTVHILVSIIILLATLLGVVLLKS
jgi:CheY-like chemotaxis protein